MRSPSAREIVERLTEWVAAAFGRGPKPVPVPIRVRANERPYPLRRDGYGDR
jgi:hypothetical protein